MEAMVCQNCGEREATVLLTVLSANHAKKAALCGPCASALEPEPALDVLTKALADLVLRTRSHTARCGTCRTTLAHFKEAGRFGCPNCYEHFAAQVRDLLPRVHAGAYRHRGKTPGRR